MAAPPRHAASGSGSSPASPWLPFDALASHVAVLDASGVIVATNAAWNRFAALGGAAPEAVGPGVDYVEACHRAARTGDALAGTIALELSAVVRGARDEFVFEYPCDCGTGRQWFICRARRLADGHVIVTHDDVTAVHDAEAQARELGRRFRDLFDQASDGILMVNRDGVVVAANPRARQLFAADALAGMQVSRLMSSRDQSSHESYIGAFFARPVARAMGARLGAALQARRLDGTTFAADISLSPVGEGENLLAAVFVRDVSARVRDEQALRATLRAKEVLLREIHHRVRNNLQIISSMLDLQGERLEPAAAAALERSRERVRAIALVHERLIRDETDSRIEFGGYIEGLSESVWQAARAAERGVTLDVSAAETWLDLDRAVPLGLILQELVSNALRHAFPDRRPGQVHIRLAPLDDERIELAVADTGVGLGTPRQAGLGLTLADQLARQLGATLLLEPRRGGGLRAAVILDGHDR
ncbi:MAG: sensor histidine kinase [Vicinamibacterales bacterium]